MTRTSIRQLAACGALLLATGPAGCQWTSSSPALPTLAGLTAPVGSAASAAPAPASAASVSAGSKGELPASQAAAACLATAEELERNGHLREASLLYEKARRHDPRRIDYARRLAVLYDLQGESERAAVEYQQSLAAHPADADLWNDAGYFHYRQQRLDQAATHLRRALELQPGHARAQVNLGIVLAAQGNYADSYSLFAAVLGEAAAHANVGALMARQGRRDEARHALRQALALDPSLPQPRALLEHLD